MKADPERPEQIADKIVSKLTAVTDACEGPPRCQTCADCDNWLEEAIAATIHAERVQAARLREKLAVLAEKWRLEGIELLAISRHDGSYSGRCEWPAQARTYSEVSKGLKAALREATQEDRSHE